MLVRVEVHTRQGTMLNLTLDDVSEGIAVEEIEGLDPVKATLISSSFAQTDGEQYHSSRRETRNIKLKLGLEPDYINDSVQDIRTRLYNFLMPKTEVTLRFHMDSGLYVDILGRVESFETPLFSKDPAVDISLICFDPDFYDPISVTIDGLSTASTEEIVVPYEGTVETGILFTLNVNRSFSEFTLYHRPEDNNLRSLDFSTPLIAGDILQISTVSGQKRVTLTRSGTITSILYAMSPQSNWIELQPGDNRLRLYAEGAALPFEIEYTTKYGGL